MANRSAFILAAVSVLLASTVVDAGPKRFPNKETTADMTGAQNVFVGWLNLDPKEWATYNYENEEDWKLVISQVNGAFRDLCRGKYLKGMKLTGAAGPNDAPAADHDLYIRFSDVSINYKELYLVLKIEFVDPRTNTVLGTIPQREYYKRIVWQPWGFERYLYNDLEEIGQKLQVEVTKKPPSK